VSGTGCARSGPTSGSAIMPIPARRRGSWVAHARGGLCVRRGRRWLLSRLRLPPHRAGELGRDPIAELACLRPQAARDDAQLKARVLRSVIENPVCTELARHRRLPIGGLGAPPAGRATPWSPAGWLSAARRSRRCRRNPPRLPFGLNWGSPQFTCPATSRTTNPGSSLLTHPQPTFGLKFCWRLA
jgi:hypothetical protein